MKKIALLISVGFFIYQVDFSSLSRADTLVDIPEKEAPSSSLLAKEKLRSLIQQAETSVRGLKKTSASTKERAPLANHLQQANLMLKVNQDRASIQHILQAYAALKVIRAKEK